MSHQGPLPYLLVSDVEIANAARTFEYARAGLGMNGRWAFGTGNLCGVLYRIETVGCVPATFVSPAADPAPWFDPNDVASEEFLGLIMLGLRGYDSTITRVVTPRIQGLGGASFSGQRRNPREWKFRAAMLSASDAGADYGLRWLTAALESSFCDSCGDGYLAVRLVCPDDDCSNDSEGLRFSYDVVLTEGPLEVEQWSPRPSSFEDTMAGCRDVVIVEWTMVAGNPFLYHAIEDCTDATIIGATVTCFDICDFLFGPPGDAVVCEVTSPLRGVLAPIYTFESVSGMNGILLGAYETCPLGSDEGDPIFEMAISGIPANSTVIVDCARREIIVDKGGVLSDGSYLIDLSDDRPLQWPQAADCDAVTCFTARTAHPCSQGGDTTVKIQTQLREG